LRIRTLGAPLLLVAMAALSLAVNVTLAQEDPTPKQPLRSPATTRGVIGGEAHASYVIEALKGQTLAVQISWKHVEDNWAEFTVSDSPNFFDGAPVAFGKASDHGGHWSGVIPRSGKYYIYVVAHPIAHYTLRVTIKPAAQSF
jgi:hypothetical protein